MTIIPPALALACSATQLDAAGCCFVLPTPYHYNTNPSSPTTAEIQTPCYQPVAETQPPCHQPVTETQTPSPSLTSHLYSAQ